ncbi:hypothetical protein EDD66_104241 [Mobilisporobacter senegalensis]|uniref:Uncharacterized protein n=1 Tax=Mobilisporobacter senegalensis TaxID=1329262 RepID=A0A3N1XPQ6_9FIRM|nr:hypothetical protein [Mobilisporobacter senegalensis]ROR28654.1 hypothetical protein EDD66_104241 [Mobilisporobacter senegalensis]
MNGYSIISTMEEKEENKFRKRKKYLPRKIYLFYLKRYVKTIYKESVYLGEKGDTIMLPFTNKEFDELDEEYKTDYIDKIIKENKIEYLYTEPNLTRFIRKIDESLIKQYRTIIMYIMIIPIMERTLKIHSIDMKDMRLKIIDSGDCKIDYILELLVNDLNHLTIITPRPEYFNEFVDIIYDNTGLVIEITSEYLDNDNTNDVIIDLSKERSRYQGNIVIDLESDIIKRQYQYLRNKNTCIIHDVIISSGNQVINNELLGFYLLRNRSFLGEFIEGKNNGSLRYSLDEISKELNLNLRELIYL